MIKVDEKDGAVTFSVRTVPRASKTEFADGHDGAVKIRIASPPVEGAANEELVKFLAKTFGVPKSSVEIVSGEHGKNKTVRIFGTTKDAVRKVLEV